ncbi:hypothetical protein UPYG_G00336660 [Umbra pygmaea]|uniref:C2H2-type domain-containing protein n=1 Tax=Umbra pygmaea TaxID=75934 RepID=A0ABD0WHV1_UMBPY
MEALRSHSQLPTGEQSVGPDQPQSQSGNSLLPFGDHQPPNSPCAQKHQLQTHPIPSKQGGPQQQQQHGLQQHIKLPNKRERKRLRPQRQSIDSDTPPVDEGKHAKAEAASTRVPRTSPEGSPSTSSSSLTCTQSTEAPAREENKEGHMKQKRERKPGKPGKYVCSYCGRACAKPSVLQKHIRSHTGERPYPCAPCGFSFKTKSNLYKHRKSHTHKVKAGLASGEPSSLEELVTESEDEIRQSSSAASKLGRRVSVANQKSHGDTETSTEQSSGLETSYAVKKRLAMRLSRGKHCPPGSSDSTTSSSAIGSKGSTESGYFSRSESTEQSQDSPPNTTSAKSYAEIILGKYGRLGHLQRMSRHQNQQPSGGQGQEGKSIPFTVPKKQVIDHITNLITINEAVVDTSKIDSVKPRRFSLSRRNSTESNSKVPLSQKEPPVVHQSNINDETGFKGSGSITMGVPCEKFHHHQSLNVDPTASQASTSSSPLLRSLSMPSSASSSDASSGVCPKNFRLSQSFDERTETQSRRFGMLQRQPAIEIHPGAEFTKEEHCLHSSSNTLYTQNMPVMSPERKQCQPQPYECECCGIGCKNWEGYKAHKRSLCVAPFPQESLDTAVSQLDHSQSSPYSISRPGALAMRKRRKEESFESEDPSSDVSSSLPTLSTSVLGRDRVSVGSRTSWPGLGEEQQCTSKGFSVIQHTSSFEKQDTFFTKSECKEDVPVQFPSHEDLLHPLPQRPLHQHSPKPTPRKLVRQHNVQVPEIFVTEDSNTNVIECVQTHSETVSIIPKQTDRTEEFQWPQRSLTLSGVPIEKLPPKKKRIRLAEAAQSSGESMSSFDSVSLPRSPSQDSCASHASSLSASFEESSRPGDTETVTGPPVRRSRASNTLTVPGLHHNRREMRRSSSEQAPHDPQQQSVLMAMSEMRSKSFDYSSLSPECSAAGWRDRRKCLLMRHTTVRDPEEEEQPAKPAEQKLNSSSSTPAKHTTQKVNNPSHCSPSLDHTGPSSPFRLSPGPQHFSLAPGSPGSSRPVSCNPVQKEQEPPLQLNAGRCVQLTGHCLEFLHSQNPVEYHDPIQRVAPASLRSEDNLLISLRPVHTYIHPALTQPHPAQPHPVYTIPAHCSSGIARAHYLPMSTGLKLEIPISTHSHDIDSELRTYSQQIPNTDPNIILSPVLLQPPISPAGPVVRLQADTNTQNCAIYTTRSQSKTPMPQERVSSGLHTGNRNTSEPNKSLAMTLPVSSNVVPGTLQPVCQLSLLPSKHLALPLLPGSELWSEDGCRISGSGSNKRMLSPSNSVDFSPESKQQQKRVKEEEEEESCTSYIISEISTREEKVEIPKCLPSEGSSTSSEGLAYPTLQSTTSHSWCYLNYIKPNPSTSTLTDCQPSVYSSWSTSEYDPNPLGLSSKTALSLLECKQRFSTTIYTMSPMSSTLAETPPKPANQKTLCPSEVHATLPDDSHRVNTLEEQQSTEDRETKKEGKLEEEEREEKKIGHEAPSTSSRSEPPRPIGICDGRHRSREECTLVRSRGRGTYMCEECGIRCKKPSMLHKHICLHTDSRPYVCKHCNFAFKTKGNLTKHVKSKFHEKNTDDEPVSGRTKEEDEDEGSEGCSAWQETGLDDPPYSDISETEVDDDDNDDDDRDDDEEKSLVHEDTSVTSTSHLNPLKTPNRTTLDQGRTRRPQDFDSGSGNPEQKPTLCCPAGTLSTKRAVFSQTHQDPGAHGSPLRSPKTDLSPSPAHHLSSSPAQIPHQSPPHSQYPKVDLPPQCPYQRRYVTPLPSHPTPHPFSSPSPRHDLSPSPCQPSPPSSRALLCCHVSRSLQRLSSTMRGCSPVRPQSPNSGPQGAPTPHQTITAPCNHPRDTSLNPRREAPATATCSKSRLMKSYSVQQSDEVHPSHLPTRTRPSQEGHGGVLSHLPLHSQHLTRTPNLMIPIGGIHMVQPRSSPLYSMVTSPLTAQDTPIMAGMDQSTAAQHTHILPEMEGSRKAGMDVGPLCWPVLKHHQTTLKEAVKPSASMYTSDRAHRVREKATSPGCSISETLPGKTGTAHLQVCSRRTEHHESQNQREETKLLEQGGSSQTTVAQTCTLSKETTAEERDTNSPVRGDGVFPVTTQGQKKPSSFATKPC